MASTPRIGFLIKKLSDSIETIANRDLASCGLTLSQSQLLMKLDQSPCQTLTMKELEQHFHAAQSTICGLVARTEAKGLVTTSTDPDDRRVKLVRITPAGLRESSACRSDIDAMERQLVSRLTKEEQAQAIRLLETMYASLRDSSPTLTERKSTPCSRP